MQYLANVLPVDPTKWTLSNATMTSELITISAGGNVSTTLDHEQVQYTPKAFKVTVKFLGLFDEFSPAAFAKLLIKDNEGMYQIFTAPLQVTSVGSDFFFMQAELITNVADFTDLIFQFNAEEYVEITEWKLYPSSDVETSTLNTIESMLPQFLFSFNESEIGIGSLETEIVNLPLAMGEAGNLSAHLLFSYVVSTTCRMIISIKLDGSPEPYTPIVLIAQEGPGFVGIPHSFLQVQAAAHLISVTVRLETLESSTSYTMSGSASLPVTGTMEGTTETGEAVTGTIDGTAEGSISGTVSIPVGTSPRLTIQAKGVRYTVEGRGILNGAGGEYPHAEVSDTYEYPTIVLGLIECSTSCEVTTSEYTNIESIDRYTYPTVSLDALGYYVDIPIASVKAFGATEFWVYNTAHTDSIHITGNVILTDTGLTFENGVGEGIATYDALYPTEDYDPIINAVEYTVAGSPNMRMAFSTDGSNWYTVDPAMNWQAIDLTYSAMSTSGVTTTQLAGMDSEVFKALFALGSTKKFTIAVYMVSSISQLSFTLSSFVVYYSTDESNLPLAAPIITFAIPDDSKARIHWQAPTGQPRAIKVYYGETESFGKILQTDIGATFTEVTGLTNRTKYYFAAATLGYGRESELSNTVSVVPSIYEPRILLCEAGISTITLQWQVVGVVYTSYNIYLGTSEETMRLYSNTTDMQATLENLRNNVEYYVAVTGVKPDEESWFSEIRTARPLLPVLEIKELIEGPDYVRMLLTLPTEYAGFVKYRVYYGTDSQSLTDFVESTSVDVTVTGLLEHTQYFFYATGLTETEESTPSEIVSAATGSYFFTTLGHTGKDKPIQADVIYPYTVEVTAGIQKFVVPEAGTYRIVATGGAGGKGGGALTNVNCLGGFGAVIAGDFDLAAGDELYMLVGQKGTDNAQTSGNATTGAGGGMTAVVVKDDTQTDILFSAPPPEWTGFTKYYYYHYRGDGSAYRCMMFDEVGLNSDNTFWLKSGGSFVCPFSTFSEDSQVYESSGTINCTIFGIAPPRIAIRTNCAELIQLLNDLGVEFTEGFVEAPTFNIPVRPLIVAGAGNGGGDAAYRGTAGDNALLDEGSSDAFLTTDYSGGGFRQYRDTTYCGKSFLAGGDAATYYYTRSNNGSYPGFGGGGANTDDGDGGGGGGYRGGVRGTHGGSSYNAGANPTAVLNTERTNGLIQLALLGGTE